MQILHSQFSSPHLPAGGTAKRGSARTPGGAIFDETKPIWREVGCGVLICMEIRLWLWSIDKVVCLPSVRRQTRVESCASYGISCLPKVYAEGRITKGPQALIPQTYIFFRVTQVPLGHTCPHLSTKSDARSCPWTVVRGPLKHGIRRPGGGAWGRGTWKTTSRREPKSELFRGSAKRGSPHSSAEGKRMENRAGAVWPSELGLMCPLFPSTYRC